ncbi:HAMP domain-containing histidine kinase [Candidatus Aminicenantes bacterium AC-335-B20]|jgi:signal transduction histidine kinase|nr:HAMP domain-containing histidine kinase [SCandidatus Aminicenantes bacterium Aminicenantia_JdfR_composite]MCP2598248.1 HAMP domain-containing histidine kinase [Candidatus Aminicenantes bacterium AC-335-L06]MCP2598880.1 HAMP domain-containing histidine kinase [Candidatus Aminicenantes bacterium AC-335-B20]
MKENIEFGEEFIVEEIAEHIDPKDEYAALFSKDKRILYLSRNLRENNFLFTSFPEIKRSNKSMEIHSLEVEGNDTHYRILTKKIVLPDNEYTLNIAVNIDDLKSIQKQLIFWLLIIMPLIGLPFILWSRFFALKISKPIEIISNKAKKITINELSQNIKIPPSYQELKELADSFNEMISKLDKSISEIKRFTSDASHELRTPLSILKGQIQLMLREKKTLPNRIRKIFEEELDEVNYMERIIDNLLLLSRYDSKKIKIENEIVDLSDLVIEQCERMKDIANKKRVKIRLGLIDPVKIRGDKSYLAQMLSNLLDNSIKYNRRNGEVYVELKAMKEKNICILTIQDTGIGIPKTDLPFIFDRFYRVDKARSRKIMGSGLGLSIVKMIVELHKGKITVKSKENEGTTIILNFPLALF